MTTGYLEIAIGPMFASKTSWLIGKYKQYSVYTDKIKVINYVGDQRYSATEVSTHDKVKIPCDQAERLKDVNIDHDKIDIVLINEGQFFEDIVEWVVDMVDNHNKQIYICGLDGDYMRNKFGKILELIPFCDKVTKLTALCSKCRNGTRAIFTHRTVTSCEQVLIGEKESYMPLCRKCYISMSKSI